MYGPEPMHIPADYGKIRFSKEELRHILFSVVVLTIAFTLAFSGIIYGDRHIIGLSTSEYFLYYLAVSCVAVFSGFLLHELAHKFVAQKNGAWAEFRSYPMGLAIALFFSVMGFLFAAPGAVYIQGMISKKQNGHISIAGPLTNLVFGGIFIALSMAIVDNILLSYGCYLVGSINLLLAVFNLLPVPPLDGYKVLKWNLPVYIVVMAAAVAMAAGIYLGWWW